jgi:hypothetical protein
MPPESPRPDPRVPTSEPASPHFPTGESPVPDPRVPTSGPASPRLESGLSPLERASLLLRWIDRSLDYSRRKRFGFRTASSMLKIGTLTLSAASTIILGVQNLDFWAGLGFALVALATVLGAVEPFFNWRSRWVLMEEQLHQFSRLHEELVMRIAAAPDVTDAMVDEFYATYSEIWSSNSRRWAEFRKAEQA